jgi:predicted transcriptional regulator of viral defense system
MNPYEVWNEILEVLSKEPDRIFNLDDLEEETGLDRENLQHALHRAYRRDDVERIAPGMYRFHPKFRRNQHLDIQSSTSINRVHIRSHDFGYEIKIPNVSLQIIDEIIGQLKLIRNQIAHK